MTTDSVSAQVADACQRYITAFNDGDVEGAVSTYAFPYFDITNVDGRPTIAVVPTYEECMKYFTEAPDNATTEKIAATIDSIDVDDLAPGIAQAKVALTRRVVADDRLVDTHTNWYTFILEEDRWKIAGYVSDYPRVTDQG